MKFISVIVPVYNGRKYINRMIKLIEQCQLVLEKNGINIDLELIFVNDNPKEIILEQYSKVLNIHVFNTDINRGIHGARLWGLDKSCGDYILFLDQDDIIKPNYFLSQLKNIGECGACICKAVFEEKNYYNDSYPFEKIVSKEYMFENGNTIISPGQVLLKKSVIPSAWKNNVIKNNGADDFFLWLCLVQKGIKFALNDDILYEHITNLSNASGNSNVMTKSENEIVKLIKEQNIYEDNDFKKLDKMLDIILENRFKSLDKYKKMEYVFYEWMNLKIQGKEVFNFLKNKGYRNIAIYGMNQIARMLIKDFKNTGLKLICVIDKNAEFLNENIMTCTPDKVRGDIDFIIIALVQGEDYIRQTLLEKKMYDVMSIAEVLEKMNSI